MSKVTMPDPSLYVLFDEDGYPFEAYGADSDATEAAIDAGGIVTIERYITTDQAEAYADARVREALEEAAAICDERALMNEQAINEEDSPDDATSLRSAAWQMTVIASRIRALIQQEKT